MNDNTKTAGIVKYNPAAPVQSPRMMIQFTEQQRPMDMICNAIEGEMTDESRTRRAKAIFEEAYIHIATAKDPMPLCACMQESAIQCLSALARSGLSLNRAFDEAYLIPFKNVMTLMASYKGFIKLATNTGLVTSIVAELVYEGDDFQPNLGTTQTIHHVPGFDHRGDPKFVKGGYGIAQMRSGEQVVELMGVDEFRKIRNSSKAKNSPAYAEWETEMQRKAIIKRLLKKVAKTADSEACRKLVAAISYDDEKFGLVERGHEIAREHSRQLEAKVAAQLGYAPEVLDVDSAAPPCKGCGKPLDHTTSNPLCKTCQSEETTSSGGLFGTDGDNDTDVENA